MNRLKAIARVIGSCFLLSLLVPSRTMGAPAAPSDVEVVPRYGATIELVVSWDDNSNDEEGFRIERRELGTAGWPWSDTVAAVVATGRREYVDTSANDTAFWEYRVCANHSTDGNSAFSDPSYPTSPRRVWPIADNDHDILHSFGTPLDFQIPGSPHRQYLHEGVDISASGKQVIAAHGGIVAAVNFPANDNGGGIRVDVDHGTLGGTERESYQHTVHDPSWSVGDIIAPADVVGTVNTTHFGLAPEADHVHWGTRNRFHLGRFTDDADRDPNETAPVVADINNDGEDFIIVRATDNDHTNALDAAWGDVDFLVDAYDDMAPGLDLMVNPYRIGYWIQPGLQGGDSVRSAADHYRLVEFEFIIPGPQVLQFPQDALVYWDLPSDLQGINTWGSRLTWIITNTRGTDGTLANVDAGQFWRTHARSGSGTEPNGSDADEAREIQEARFPDGTYFVHVLLGDLVNNEEDYLRSVLVDNWRPYVRKVRVLSGPRLIYQSERLWDGGSVQLEAHPNTFDEAATFTALRTQNLTIEVEFSEPMQSASITGIVPQDGQASLGVALILAPKTGTATRVWTGVIANGLIDDDGGHDGVHLLHIAGRDLAGNELLEIDSRAAIGVNHHNRDATGTLRGTVGEDSIHGFRIGPLAGELTIAAIFMKQEADDPEDVTKEELAAYIETSLDAYFPIVSYGAVEGFVVNPYGWYRMDYSLDWYEADDRTPLIDQVQEAVAAAEADGAPIQSSDYVLVVTDETTPRVEWSAGPWPYKIDADPGMRLIAAGTVNRASIETSPRLTNTVARMLGLIDLYAYPEVRPIGRPFVGPWSHMSDKLHGVHPLGWEKWRAGWIDETGTTTGNRVERVTAPDVGSPIEDSRFTLHPLDTDSNGLKVLALEVAEGLHFTAEYRRLEQLDADLPDTGVLITRANDLINQGEGPILVQESNIPTGNLDNAPFTATAPRNQFEDLGSGVRLEVISITPDEAEVRLDYTVPETENDVFVAEHDGSVKSEDIWIDAPDLEGNYAADPLSAQTTNELPVVGAVNRVYGRVRNQGHADALDVTVHLEIREPWGAGGPWRELASSKTVPLLQGQDTNPGAYELIMGEWMPSGDPHACVQLWTDAVDYDEQPGNNWTQQNFSDFDSVSGSPFSPITSRFGVENPFDETVPVLFRVDGLPDGWSYSVTPERLSLPALGVGDALVTIQPDNDSQVCSREQITLTAYTPRVDTLKRIGGITLQIALKNPLSITAESALDCGRHDVMKSIHLMGHDVPAAWTSPQTCVMNTEGCTDPALPNTQVALIYTGPDGTREVRYNTTDELGCYLDTVTIPDEGLWSVQAVIESTDCREGAGSPTETVDVRTPAPGICGEGGVVCCILWMVALVAFATAFLLWARYRCDMIRTPVWAFVALAIAGLLIWLLLNVCRIQLCWLLLSLALVLLLVAVILCRTNWAPCICNRSKEG